MTGLLFKDEVSTATARALGNTPEGPPSNRALRLPWLMANTQYVCPKAQRNVKAMDGCLAMTECQGSPMANIRPTCP